MTKAQMLLQAMNDIDDAFLLEAEETLAQQKKPRKRPFKWFVIVLAILGLSSGAYAAIQWTPYFMGYFQPTAELISKTEGNVQDVRAIAEYEDLTLRVEQTIGDEHSMYIQLDVSLPEGQTWREVLPNEAIANKEYVHLSPAYELYAAEITKEDIQNLSVAEIQEKYKEQRIYTDSASGHGSSLDLDSNRDTRMIGVFANHTDFTETELTLLILHFDNHYETIKEGPYAITWKPENKGTQYEYQLINKKGRSEGMIFISSFNLEVSYQHYNMANSESKRGYATSEEFVEDIIVHFKDGTQKNAKQLCNGGGITFSDSWASFDGHFRTILDLDTVESVQVGPYICELE